MSRSFRFAWEDIRVSSANASAGPRLAVAISTPGGLTDDGARVQGLLQLGVLLLGADELVADAFSGDCGPYRMGTSTGDSASAFGHPVSHRLSSGMR